MNACLNVMLCYHLRKIIDHTFLIEIEEKGHTTSQKKKANIMRKKERKKERKQQDYSSDAYYLLHLNGNKEDRRDIKRKEGKI